MKNFTSFIPCYIWNDKDFYEWLKKTIESIRNYQQFWIVKLFICQKNKESYLKEWCKKYENIKIIYLEEKTPMYFPIDVFNYMKNDKKLSDEDYVFYVEWDHILHVSDWFFKDIFEELDKWNVVMPHRLWKTRAVNDIEYQNMSDFMYEITVKLVLKNIVIYLMKYYLINYQAIEYIEHMHDVIL